MDLRRRVPTLAQDLLAAEDELDIAQTELRKRKRHSQAQWGQRRPDVSATAGVVLDRQYEVRAAQAAERAEALASLLREVEGLLEEAAKKSPLSRLQSGRKQDPYIGFNGAKKRIPI